MSNSWRNFFLRIDSGTERGLADLISHGRRLPCGGVLLLSAELVPHIGGAKPPSTSEQQLVIRSLIVLLLHFRPPIQHCTICTLLFPLHIPDTSAQQDSTSTAASKHHTTMATIQDIADEQAFQSAVSALPPSTLAVIYFHAPWAKPCEQMSIILKTLASTYPASAPISFLALNAEEVPEVSEEYDVTAVPYIVLQKDGKTLETVSGSDAAKVRAAVEKYAGAGSGDSRSTLPPAQTVTRPAQSNGTDGAKSMADYAPSASDPKTAPEYSATEGEQETNKEELMKRLAELVKAAPVMLFMKGTPSAPQCGFSRQTVSVLREKGVRYGFFNILADDEVRQGLKEYADWPTFPQLWVDGELVGGLDIVGLHDRLSETC